MQIAFILTKRISKHWNQGGGGADAEFWEGDIGASETTASETEKKNICEEVESNYEKLLSVLYNTVLMVQQHLGKFSNLLQLGIAFFSQNKL